MDKRPLALAIALAVAPLPAAAAPDPALAPLAFLAGHCWVGTMPGTADTDEHCFAWLYDGRYLRDRHVVRRTDGYEVLREYDTAKGWVPVRMVMKKVGR